MKTEEILKYRESFSQEQLNEIIKLYEESDEKVADIINRFQLEIRPNQIATFLPGAEVDEDCPYCFVPMKRKRHRKNGYVYSSEIYCECCGHKDDGYRKCKCSNCQEKENQILVQRKKRIYDYYSDLIPENKIAYDDLPLKNKALLFLLFLEIKKCVDYGFIDSRLITNDKKIYFIRRLLEEKILFVSPMSSMNGFSDVDFPSRFYVDSVDYIVNVNFSEENEVSIRKREFPEITVYDTEVQEFMRELIFDDLLDQFEKLLEERHISFEPSYDQLEDFRQLVNYASYTEIEYICYKVAVFYSDLIVTGKAYNKKLIPQQVLASVINFYDKGIEKYGSVYKSKPEYAGYVLRSVIEKVLKKDISILNEVI